MCDLKIKTVFKKNHLTQLSLACLILVIGWKKNIFPTFLELRKWCQEFFGSRMCALLRKTGIECFFS